MSPPVELVYELRQLLARCGSRAGLDMTEIEAMSSLEEELSPRGQLDVDMAAQLRTSKDEDRVKLVAIGARTMMVTAAPYLEPGSVVELVIDDEVSARSYRFKARVTSLDDDVNNLYKAGLELVGAPLLIRKRLKTADIIEVAA
jgi:hypothetical protein